MPEPDQNPSNNPELIAQNVEILPGPPVGVCGRDLAENSYTAIRVRRLGLRPVTLAILVLVGTPAALWAHDVLGYKPLAAHIVRPPMPPRGGDLPPVQGEFIKEINSNRGSLFAGRASAAVGHAQARKPFPLDLTVCASQTAGCKISKSPTPPPSAGERLIPALPGQASGLGKVMIGGRVRAEMTGYDKRLRITAASRTEQTITAPDDVGEWRWTVEASDDDTYAVRISVTTLKADSDVALFPTRNFDVFITIEDSLGERVKAYAKASMTWLGGAAGVAALLAAVVGLLTFLKSRKDKAVTNGVNPASGGTVRVRQVVPERPGMAQTTNGRKRRRRRAGR